MFPLEEVINLLCVLCLLVGLRLTNRLDVLVFWVFLGRVAMVFLTNDVLFPVSYMPDQLGYVYCADMRRGGSGTWCGELIGKNTLNASWFFALFPMPFIVSVRSIALVNAVLIVWLYIYLSGKGFFSSRARLVYLLYPSFVLYGAVAVRDIAIAICMFMAIYYLLEKKSPLLGVVWVTPLFFIKQQNALMTLIPFALAMVAGKSRVRMVVAVVLGFVFALVMLLGAGYLAELNDYRNAFYAEDGGIGKIPPLSSSPPVLLFELLIGAFSILLMPLPWQAGNAFQLIQSLENVLMMWLVVQCWRRRARPGMANAFMNLKIFFVSSMAIYGAVISNYGTAARYRFAFILLFILFAERLTQPDKEKLGNPE